MLLAHPRDTAFAIRRLVSSSPMRHCAFCSNSANSQEHIWSEWILGLLPESKDGKFTLMLPDGSYKTKRLKKPVHTAGVVCRSCNNGWMSNRLEKPMQQATESLILETHEKTFTPADCLAIARWAFKTTVVANHMNRDEESFFPEQHRLRFAADQTIAPGIHVWLSRRYSRYFTTNFRVERVTKRPATDLMPHLVSLPPSPYEFQIYACTLVIGWLCLQVAATRWTKRQVAESVYPPTISQNQVFDDYAIPIFIPRKEPRSVSWPPPQVIGDKLFVEFWKRWERPLDLPSWMR